MNTINVKTIDNKYSRYDFTCSENKTISEETIDIISFLIALKSADTISIIEVGEF